jgi:short-subunit dehydrogenase
MHFFGLIFAFVALLSLASSQKVLRDPFTGDVIKPPKEEKIIVVVTGSSTGIGRDTAIEFAKSSRFRVYATMRDPRKARFTPETLSESQSQANLDNIIVKQMDVTSDQSVERCIGDILREESGRIDILVNNAGYGLAGCLEHVTITEAQKLFDVNVWGAVRAMQAILPSMRKRMRGHVINVSSTSGIRGIPCMEYYSGSKFALEGIADSMRYSMSAYNISVTMVNPGPVRTKFTETFGVGAKGGLGTRAVPGEVALPADGSASDAEIATAERANYLSTLNKMVVASLNRRLSSAEAQDSEDTAIVIVHLAVMRLDSRRIEDIPFSMGTSKDSQAVLEAVKKQPTGWGGMYGNLLKSVPPLPSGKVKGPGRKDEL